MTRPSAPGPSPSGPACPASASAAPGTGWATGHKTYNNPISVDQTPLPTILEAAQQAGYTTGKITTAELTDATPAVLDSHISLRACQGPADIATCPNETKQAGGRAQSHTGTEVRIAARGPQAANVVGITDQSDLFHTMARALGVE